MAMISNNDARHVIKSAGVLTFEEWWELINKDHPEAGSGLPLIVKDIARFAWIASRENWRNYE